jgi:hypothetical protein
VATLTGPDGQTWRVYHVRRKDRPDLFDGRRLDGITWFGRRKIFIDASRPAALIFETTVHEFMHVVLRDLGFDHNVLEEAFVQNVSERLAAMLEQL